MLRRLQDLASDRRTLIMFLVPALTYGLLTVMRYIELSNCCLGKAHYVVDDYLVSCRWVL